MDPLTKPTVQTGATSTGPGGRADQGCGQINGVVQIRNGDIIGGQFRVWTRHFQLAMPGRDKNGRRVSSSYTRDHMCASSCLSATCSSSMTQKRNRRSETSTLRSADTHQREWRSSGLEQNVTLCALASTFRGWAPSSQRASHARSPGLRGDHAEAAQESAGRARPAQAQRTNALATINRTGYPATETTARQRRM